MQGCNGILPAKEEIQNEINTMYRCKNQDQIDDDKSLNLSVKPNFR